MSYKIKALTDFEKELKQLSKKYKSLGFDLSKLLANLQENPSLGTPIGKNFNKIRLAISSKNQGKSGEGRELLLVFKSLKKPSIWCISTTKVKLIISLKKKLKN